MTNKTYNVYVEGNINVEFTVCANNKEEAYHLAEIEAASYGIIVSDAIIDIED